MVLRGTELLKKVEACRHEDVLLDGDLVPKSAAMLFSMLKSETDPQNRFQIYGSAVLECQLANRTPAALKFASERYREFPRDVTARMFYSDALIRDGKLAAGLVVANEAVQLAIEAQTLINYAAGNLVRATIKTGSAEKVNEAIERLIASTYAPRDGDCALETDWTEKAEVLGADKELIARVRRHALSHH